MNLSHRLALLSVLVSTIWMTPLPAQTTETPAPETPAPSSTVITSDELRADDVTHTAVFSGNVVVVGSNFTLKAQQMTVTFTKDSKVDNIVAKGDVVIEQPGRVSHCGQAQYFREEDKFVLTDQPVILDNKSQISAPTIIIYRTQKSMETVGRTTTKMLGELGNGASPSPNSNPK